VALSDAAAVERARGPPRHRLTTRDDPAYTTAVEYVDSAPDRFAGLALLPNRGGPTEASPKSSGGGAAPHFRWHSSARLAERNAGDQAPMTILSGEALSERRSRVVHPRSPDCIDAGRPRANSRVRAVLRCRPTDHRDVFDGVFDRFPPARRGWFSEVESGGCLNFKERSTTTISASTRSAASRGVNSCQRLHHDHFHFHLTSRTFGCVTVSTSAPADPLVERLPAHQRYLTRTRGRSDPISMSGVVPADVTWILHGKLPSGSAFNAGPPV